MNKILMPASNVLISEMKSTRKHMVLSMRMFSTRENLNHNAVTEAFIDDIIANKDEYVCMPLCADVKKLRSKDYGKLTHLYDGRTGTFLAEEIGSFYDFEKTQDEYGVSLIGYAKVNKRDDRVTEAISELYAQGKLNFSFEISAGEIQEQDGVMIVDASPENELMAMAIVSIPAYPESKALSLAASADIQNLFETARYLSSELDVETVRMQFGEGLYAYLGDQAWEFRVLLFCPDCAILYHWYTGHMFKAEFEVIEDKTVIIDIYEVELTRMGGSEEAMDNEMDFAERVEDTEQVEAVKAEAQETEEREVVAEAEAAEEASDSEIVEAEAETEPEAEPEAIEAEAEVESEAAEDAVDVAQMQAELEELRALKNKYEELKAEMDALRADEAAKQLAAKKQQLIDYAMAEKLDIESEPVKTAIENMDHEALIAEVMKRNAEEADNDAHSPVLANYFSIDARQGNDYLLGHKQ